jgi:hypothetical protein
MANVPFVVSEHGTFNLPKTDNEEFNKALFETAKNMGNTFSERYNFIDAINSSLGYNNPNMLFEAKARGMTIEEMIEERIAFEKEKYKDFEDKSTLNSIIKSLLNWKITSYDSFINDMVDEYKSLSVNPALSPESRVRYQITYQNLLDLDKNYQKIKSSSTSTNELQSINSTNDTPVVYYKEVPKVDYSKYSANDLIKIPYEEAKANNEAIKAREQELWENGDMTTKQKDKLFSLKGTLHFSQNILGRSDDSFDKAFYETIQSTPEPTGLLRLEFMMNATQFARGENVTPSFMVGLSPSFYNFDLNFSNIDFFSAFLNNALSSFERELTDAKNSPNTKESTKEQFQDVVDFYKRFQENWERK